MVKQEDQNANMSYFENGFKQLHQMEFGFNFPSRQILIDNIRVRSVGKSVTTT